MKLGKFKGLIELVVAHLVIIEKRKTNLVATKILVPGSSAAGTSMIPIAANSFETTLYLECPPFRSLTPANSLKQAQFGEEATESVKIKSKGPNPGLNRRPLTV